MISIARFTVEGLKENCVTDNPHPMFAFYYESEDQSIIDHAIFTLSNGYKKELKDEVSLIYDGPKFDAYTRYEATLTAVDNKGNETSKTIYFETGKLSSSWEGKWITDGSYEFTDKGISPRIMTFRKKVMMEKEIKEAKIYATAIGVYRIDLNGAKVGNAFLKPGFTSYANNLMYQVYDVKEQLKNGQNDLVVNVGGGWAVGAFVFTRVNRVYAARQALLLELRVKYTDGSEEVIPSDTSFDVSLEGPYVAGDLYDGECFDARVDYDKISYHKASLETMKLQPKIMADYSSDIVVNREMPHYEVKEINGKWRYDFKQNLAGVVHLHIKKAKAGQKIIVHHAEVLLKDGELNLDLLRTAKCTLEYICKDGEQDYTPEFTYMGFRYITIEGIAPEHVDVVAYHLTSDIEETGAFKCSNEMLNQLDSNIRWSSRNNFEDIPTDCPQRDERMGWTGDISIFAPTASYNFQMDRFLRKWLVDVKSEQLKSGSLPNTVPIHGYGFPATMPKMAIDFWGDAILTVPYALYEAYGDLDILKSFYPNMKKYVKAEKFWANIWGVGKYRYIWHTPALFHFGDWVSPDVDQMSAWQKRSKYTATASLRRCSQLLAHIASILGEKEDQAYYEKLSEKVKDAYVSVFTSDGKLKKEEFQTGYVLPLAFDMFEGQDKENALKNLVALIEKNDYCIGTGFPGTPYILFVLADNGYEDVAYKMLLNTKAPSWLYNVSVGGTTIWEKFDGMLADGTCRPSKDGTGNMVSFDHYASGSVGEFLYTRIAGLRIVEPGYKKFAIKPVLGGDITSVETSTLTPYGRINLSWKKEEGQFKLHVDVPMSTTCQVTLPNGEEQVLTYGCHDIACAL